MDMDISHLVKDGKLAWMPAHQSLQMVGETKLSNGCRLTAIDWRANRLVDVLAKTAAADLQASKDTLALLSSAEAAAGHATALLGVVTHAANNFKEVVVSEDGTSTTRVLRDSTDKPKAKRVLATPPAPLPATSQSAPAKTEVAVAPWRPPAPATQAKRRRVEADAEALAASVERIGSSMSSRSHVLTGKQRLAALAGRVASNSQLLRVVQ